MSASATISFNRKKIVEGIAKYLIQCGWKDCGAILNHKNREFTISLKFLNRLVEEHGHLQIVIREIDRWIDVEDERKCRVEQTRP